MDDLADLLAIPVARIIEVRPDKEIVLDQAFIPSCLDARASQALSGFLRELEGLLAHRMEALAGRLSEAGGARGVADVSDFMLLAVVNRMLPQVRHLRNIENLHPSACSRYAPGWRGTVSVHVNGKTGTGIPTLYP